MNGFSEEAAQGFSYRYEGESLLAERSRFQQIDVYEHPTFGRVLMLDGLVQTTENDEFVYHEMLVHVPLLTLESPCTVLIIGGGDGGTLRRVLEHPTVERAVMVEIDRRVSDVCREWLPSIAGDAFDDPRAEVRFEDGIAYVGRGGEPFDAILIDSSDPVGPGAGLFTAAFYSSARERLVPAGIVVAQSGSPYFQQDELHRTYGNVRSAFSDARVYLANVPTYPGCLWAFTLAGAQIEPDPAIAANRAVERGIRARYWTPEIQRGAFDLPKIVQEVIDPAGPPRTWGASPEEHGRRTVPRS